MMEKIILALSLLLVYCGSIYGEDQGDAMKVGQKLHKAVKEFNATQYRYTDGVINDRRYAVYDNLLSAKSQILIKTFLSYSTDAWMFMNYDRDGINKQKTHDNCPWINEKDPLEFSRSKLNKRLIQAVQDTAKDYGDFYPYRIFGKIIRRGDHTLVSADSSVEGDYTVYIFVNHFWRKNYYGELYLYDKDREIVAGATCRPGRVVVYESTILRLNRPPAVQFLQGQVLFQVQYSKSKERMHKGNEDYLSYMQDKKEAYATWNLPDYKLPNGDPFVVPDPAKHKVFEYTSKREKRKVFVFDGLFSDDLLNHLRHFVLNYGSYFYDDSIDKSSDNVVWVAGFLVNPYVESPYWKILQKATEYATGNSELFPYDISINLVRSADHTRIHQDVGYHGETEYTALVYMTPDWDKNYYGETTFFEKNSDDTEIIAQVRPRYGRLVIFDGNIPHSARPPSYNFSGARLTYVTKMHRNEFMGRKKNFMEEFKFYEGTKSVIDQLKIFATKRGGSIAKKMLEEEKARHRKLNFRPDKETGDDEEPEAEEEEGEISDPAENDPLPEGQMFRIRKEPFFEEGSDMDPFTKKLHSQLKDAKENPEGVEKIMKAYNEMREKDDTLTERVAAGIIDVM